MVSEESLYLLQENLFCQQQNELEKNFCYIAYQSLWNLAVKKISKTSAENHDIKYGQKANRRFIDTANETKTDES